MEVAGIESRWGGRERNSRNELLVSGEFLSRNALLFPWRFDGSMASALDSAMPLIAARPIEGMFAVILVGSYLQSGGSWAGAAAEAAHLVQGLAVVSEEA